MRPHDDREGSPDEDGIEWVPLGIPFPPLPDDASAYARIVIREHPTDTIYFVVPPSGDKPNQE